MKHALAAFALMGAGREEDDALAVLRWIEVNRLDGFTRRECQRAMQGRFRTSDRLTGALKLLQEWACISAEIKRPSEDGAGRGRPSAIHLVNPKLYPTATP